MLPLDKFPEPPAADLRQYLALRDLLHCLHIVPPWPHAEACVSVAAYVRFLSAWIGDNPAITPDRLMRATSRALQLRFTQFD